MKPDPDTHVCICQVPFFSKYGPSFEAAFRMQSRILWRSLPNLMLSSFGSS